MATEWLENLKRGDMVGVVTGSECHGYQIDAAVVERVTAGRKWAYVNGAKFWLRDGRACGPNGKWMARQLVEVLDWQKERHTRLFVLASGADWRALPLSTLEAVVALLDKETETT